MRQLTRDQIMKICNIEVTKVLIGPGKNFHTINIYPETDCETKIRQYLIEEHRKLPAESRIHLDYLTSHPTVLCEVSFPESL